eukprot:m.84739 g.84739  ORF g.84739 m.84739 type:complete len:54 (+) comp14397_c1_seq1:2147-2308(+)
MVAQLMDNVTERLPRLNFQELRQSARVLGENAANLHTMLHRHDDLSMVDGAIC